MKREDIEKAAGNYSGSILGFRDNQLVMDKHKAFADGAEWRINSVWNNNNVTPGYNCRVLIEDIYGNIYEDKYDADYNEYDSAIEQKEIKRWAYIKDLIPDTEG